MKKFLLKTFLGSALMAGLLSSCGEDRSGEYYALISSKSWMYETMQQYYLFYQDLPDKEELNFFDTPANFLSATVSDKDKKNGYTFSHIDSIPESRSSMSEYPCFGFEGALIRTSSGDYAIRVIYTEKDSPAEKAGLKRGDWIIAADNKAITSNDYNTYIKAPAKSYTFTMGTYNGEGFDTIPTPITMPQPEYVKINNLLKTSILTAGNRKAAYLLYNSFGEDDTQDLQQAMTQLAAEQPTDVILDLRYNPGGYVNTSMVLASMLAPADAVGKTYIDLLYNDKREEKTTFLIDAAYRTGGTTFSYNNLYIITSGETASASEAVINGLKPYMQGKLFQVGTATFGKNLGQELFNSEEAPQLNFWLTTFYLANSEGFYDYFDNGLPADYTIEEDFSGELGELGSNTDALLKPVLTHLETGAFPAVENPAEQATKTSRNKYNTTIVYNSIAAKSKKLKK